ncbi:methyltransferase [candidate division WWE3 bacterium]|uniref:Methyltransferase n=1 Tax=candidate division WWE3 bacterium TaxID=2053526 RepID=A0A7X9HH84_UNCKA|nr:methyltransferase [candidate division WWE3 bacterium]
MLRISTGIAKNKSLETPEIVGFRAVQEIAKMAVFSIIGNDIADKTCLDLFSGSGNMGIEALSRGAGFCTFVDENPLAITTIEKNLFKCGFFENFDIYRKNVLKFVNSTDKRYDVIFLDPFYQDKTNKHLIKSLPRICNDNAYIFFFHASDYDLSLDAVDSGLKIVSQRRFGKSSVSQLTKKV